MAPSRDSTGSDAEPAAAWPCLLSAPARWAVQVGGTRPTGPFMNSLAGPGPVVFKGRIGSQVLRPLSQALRRLSQVRGLQRPQIRRGLVQGDAEGARAHRGRLGRLRGGSPHSERRGPRPSRECRTRSDRLPSRSEQEPGGAQPADPGEARLGAALCLRWVLLGHGAERLVEPGVCQPEERVTRARARARAATAPPPGRTVCRHGAPQRRHHTRAKTTLTTARPGPRPGPIASGSPRGRSGGACPTCGPVRRTRTGPLVCAANADKATRVPQTQARPCHYIRGPGYARTGPRTDRRRALPGVSPGGCLSRRERQARRLPAGHETTLGPWAPSLLGPSEAPPRRLPPSPERRRLGLGHAWSPGRGGLAQCMI